MKGVAVVHGYLVSSNTLIIMDYIKRKERKKKKEEMKGVAVVHGYPVSSNILIIMDYIKRKERGNEGSSSGSWVSRFIKHIDYNGLYKKKRKKKKEEMKGVAVVHGYPVSSNILIIMDYIKRKEKQILRKNCPSYSSIEWKKMSKFFPNF